MEEAPPRPEAPEKLELEAIEQQVREKASRIRRKPGEPLLIPVLSASGAITAIDLCPRYEHKPTPAPLKEEQGLKDRGALGMEPDLILCSAFQGRKKSKTGCSQTLFFH